MNESDFILNTETRICIDGTDKGLLELRDIINNSAIHSIIKIVFILINIIFIIRYIRSMKGKRYTKNKWYDLIEFIFLLFTINIFSVLYSIIIDNFTISFILINIYSFMFFYYIYKKFEKEVIKLVDKLLKNIKGV